MRGRDGTGISGSYIWGYHEETPSERKLARALREAGLKFAREVPVGKYTVDFLLDQWLVVEVEGETHLAAGRAERDARRQEELERMGFTVIRVPAYELSSGGGLKRWTKKIRDVLSAGPPYVNQPGFENTDYRQQIERVKKALRLGEIEQNKRLNSGTDTRTSGGRNRDNGEEETMEEYFGSKSYDFKALLDGIDWAKVQPKDDDDLEASRNMRHRKSRRR